METLYNPGLEWHAKTARMVNWLNDRMTGPETSPSYSRGAQRHRDPRDMPDPIRPGPKRS